MHLFWKVEQENRADNKISKCYFYQEDLVIKNRLAKPR